MRGKVLSFAEARAKPSVRPAIASSRPMRWDRGFWRLDPGMRAYMHLMRSAYDAIEGPRGPDGAA